MIHKLYFIIIKYKIFWLLLLQQTKNIQIACKDKKKKIFMKLIDWWLPDFNGTQNKFFNKDNLKLGGNP